jgi:RNA polymerase sigma-70 factor (ECF subfamily)
MARMIVTVGARWTPARDPRLPGLRFTPTAEIRQRRGTFVTGRFPHQQKDTLTRMYKLMSGPPAEAALVGHAEVADPIERLAQLFDAHGDRLYRLARRLTGNADDARDLVQDTFLRAAKSAKSIPRGEAGEEAWLVRILVNLQRDHWRRTAMRSQHDAAHACALHPARGSDLETALIARTTVWRALEQMPPRRRAILVLHELEGLEVRAIASLLLITPMTVRWHLSHGRRQLASLIKVMTGE